VAKIQKHIEIVRSTVSSLNSLSSRSANAIEKTLKLHYSHVHISIVNTLSDLQDLVAKQPDLVFAGMKYVPLSPSLGFYDSPKIWLSEYLDDAGIAFTGSGRLAHELEHSKDLAKQRVLDAGLLTSAFYVIRKDNTFHSAPKTLDYPVFIKPLDRGGGQGIDSESVAHDYQALKNKVESLAAKYNADSLIEKYLSGREFSVAVLKGDAGYFTMPLELIAPQDSNGARILSARVKSAESETFAPVRDQELKAELNELALNVFHALGARDYGRIDIRLDDENIPHFLEANLIPSLIEGYGNFPKACLLNRGMAYEAMLLHIVELGLARQTYTSNELDVLPPVFFIPAVA